MHSRGIVLGLGGVLAVAAVSLGTARIVDAGAPPKQKGLAAGVAALSNLPPEATVPARVIRFVEATAPANRANPAEMTLGVRKLRTNLGTTRSSLYAYRAPNGSVCWLLVGHGGTCPDVYAGTYGLQWTIGGGYGDVPGNFVGIAADDVSSVELIVDGVGRDVPIRNNVVFAELPNGAERAEIVVKRTDGSDDAATVRLNG